MLAFRLGVKTAFLALGPLRLQLTIVFIHVCGGINNSMATEPGPSNS